MYFAHSMNDIDIILPAYNPLPGWENIVINRFQSLQQQLLQFKLHLIVVNDGSSTINEEVSLKILKQTIPLINWITYKENKGKGYALRKGVKVSTSAYIIYTDIDWPYTENSMIGLINELSKDVDAVIGTRNMDYHVHLPPARRKISRFLKKINSGLLRLKVNDTQAGLKGFRNNIRELFLKTTINRYLFDLEFIKLLSQSRNIKVIGYPVQLREGVKFSKMNSKILLSEAGNFLVVLLKNRRNKNITLPH